MIRFRRRAGSLSLRVLLFAGFLSSIVLVLVFITASWLPQMSAALEDNAIERSREMVLQTVNTVDTHLSNLENTLHLACSLVPNEPADDQTPWRQMLHALKKDNHNIVEFAFFASDGSCLFDTAGGVRLGSDAVRQKEWFVKAQEWEGAATYFSRPHVQSLFSSHRAHVITLSQHVEYMHDGQVHSGVMLMDVRYASLSDLLNAVRLNTSGYVYLVDPQGELITHPQLSLIQLGLFNEDMTAVEKKVVGSTRDIQDGQERLLLIATLNKTRWRLVGVAYANEILRMEQTMLFTFSIALIAAVFLGIATAAAIAYIVTHPIKKLEARINDVECGNLFVSMNEDGFEEIRSVSKSFNLMLSRIRQLMQQVVEEQEKKRLHELNALQAQINPHFLYNTLDSIIWMEEQGQSQEAIAMVGALAKLFRISISKGRPLITVEEEMEHVRNYVIIQKIRFGNRFECEIDVQEDAAQATTLKLIVQPIVENALNHAIDQYADQPLHIRVHAFATEDELLFSIEDDGVGIPAERLASLLHAAPGASGIGLKNVHERIRLTFGAPFGLEIHSEEDVGTTVILRQPRVRRDAT